MGRFSEKEKRILQEFEEQRRKFMMGKGQEGERLREVGPVSVDPFADEEYYKPRLNGASINYKYT